MALIKPDKLVFGDNIATVSPSWGCAGDADFIWRYTLGKDRLQNEFNLNVIAAPNSMRGEDFLSRNPAARADDIMWAFENKNVQAIIANIGGNDSYKIIPFIDKKIIANNPKIFIGYSDVMNIHLLCHKFNLSSFYGPNLLTVIANPSGFHPYSKLWFGKILFSSDTIGVVNASDEWSCDEVDFTNSAFRMNYHANEGYKLLQGHGKVQGRLIGGHTRIMDTVGTEIELTAEDFMNKILFLEDIVECISSNEITKFFEWLGSIGALNVLKAIILGKINTYDDTKIYENEAISVINDRYGLYNLPIISNMNFGHTSHMCILPYGALAEIDCENVNFSILESGVT